MYGIYLRGIALALSLTMGGAAYAQTHAAPPVSAVGDPACLAADVDGNCLLRCDNRALEISVQKTGEISIVLHGAAPGSVKTYSVQQDLQASVNARAITTDDASAIFTELSRGDGAVYSVPDALKLKSDLGFPENQDLAASDWPDLLRAHVQRMLGVDPRTASYLTSRIEIQMPPATALPVALIPLPGEPTSIRN